MSQGLDNLDGILESTQRIAQALDGLEGVSLSDECHVLQASVEPLEGLRDKFFMNTVAAIPISKACLTHTEKVQNAVESFRDDQGDASLSALKNALKDLSESVQFSLTDFM